MRVLLIGLIAGVVAVSPAVAATELVQNGDFSTYSTPNGQSYQMSADNGGKQYVSNWYNMPTSCATVTSCNLTGGTAGYNMLITSASAATTSGGITTNDNPTMSLWSATGSNTIGGSGGSFIGADGAYEQSLIAQTLSGLTVGQKYQLTFNFAGAQQSGYDGNTTEAWTAYFGEYGSVSQGVQNVSNVQSYTTQTLNDTSHGFTGWYTATTTFTATGTTEFLAFLAKGTPDGKPPFSLLDDVSFKAVSATVAAVPEPASWAMMIGGFGLIGSAMRRKRAADQFA